MLLPGLTLIDVFVWPVLHVYVDAPLALSVVELPEHIVAGAAAADKVGKGFTVTITVAVALHPPALVPVTVYVWVDVGLAVTVVLEVALKPVDGDHV